MYDFILFEGLIWPRSFSGCAYIAFEASQGKNTAFSFKYNYIFSFSYSALIFIFSVKRDMFSFKCLNQLLRIIEQISDFA